MPPLRFPKAPRPSDDLNYAATGNNPVPPGSVGPVAFTPTTTLPLPPLGAVSKANAIPPLQKVTVQLPQAAPMPAMPSLTGRPMGSQALSDAFRYRFMNRIASQMDPESSFANELAAAQQSKAIHDLVYPAATPKDVYQKAQDALVAENYARSLRGEPPIEVANAQAQAAKAQTAAEAAQKEAEADQTAALAKRMNPAAHYLASPEGLQQYSDENGINLDPSDITRLDEMGRNAASAVVTNQPSAYWNAVGIDLAPPSAGETPAQVGAETPQNSSVTMLLQSPRFAQAYGGSTEGGVHRGNAPAHLKDYYPSGTLPGDYQPPPDRSNDVVGVGADASLNPEGIPASFGHFPGYGQGVLGTASAMGPFPNYADASSLPLPPGGALPNQPPPDVRTQVTHALQGAATAGVLIALAAVAGRRLGLNPLKAGALAAALVGGGDVPVEQGWVGPAVDAFGQTLAKPGQFIRAGLGSLNPRDPAQAAANLALPGVGGLVASEYEGLINAYKQADPTLPPLQRFDQAIEIAQKPFNTAIESIAKPLETNPALGPAAPFAAGAVRTGANLVTDPLMYTPGAIGKMAVRGMVVGGLGGLLQSSLAGGTPEQQAQAVQSGADIGMMVGPALAHGVPFLRKLISRGETPPAVEGVTPSPETPPPTEPAVAAVAPETLRDPAVIKAEYNPIAQQWSQWLEAHPNATEAEIEAHPLSQQMANLVDEYTAAIDRQNAPVAPAEPVPQAAPPAAAAVVPPVASDSATTTAALLHPVTGENLATGDFQRDTETRLALQELNDAAAQAKLAKGKKQITAATKRLQTAAQAIGGSDTAQVDALIQQAMESTVTPPVAEAAATGGGLTDLEATQGTELARQQAERAQPATGYQAPDLTQTIPVTDSLKATPGNDPLLALNTEGVMTPSGLSREWYRPAPRGAYGGAQGGWKLHVSLGGDLQTTGSALSSQEKNYRAVSDYLASKGIEHKVGRGGSHNEGKGMTIYVGARDDAMKVAEDLNAKFGKIIAKVPREDAKVYDDDVPFVGNIMGRFDAQDSKPTVNAPTGYASYGAKGMSVEKNLLNNHAFTPGGIPTYEQDAYNTLAKDYGAFFTGTEHPFTLAGDVSPAEAFAPQPETATAQPEVAPLATESAVAPITPGVPQGKPLEGPVGKTTTAFGLTDPNVQYQMRDRIVPLDSLIVSHDISGAENPEFNQAYQNRNRAAMASEQQTNAVAKNTAAESLIADQRALDKGSPIVSPDSMVLGGNGRSLGLLKARAANPAEWEKYQAELRNVLPEHGFSEADIAGIKDPVLVREITDPNVTDLTKFAAETNKPPGLTLSPMEQAAQDSHIISDQAVINMAVGSEGNVDLAIAKNPRLLAAYQQAIPLTARSGLMSASGEMTQDLITRVKRALIFKTYGGSEAGQALAQRFIDGVHVDAAPVQNAILANLPAMAKLEAEIAQGIRSGSLSLTEDVAKAFDALVTMKSNGLSDVDEFLAGQGGANVRGKVGGFTVRKPGMENLATPELTPAQTMLLKFFNQYGRSSATVRDFLDGYVANATATDNLMNLSFMDALNPVDRQTLLSQASATVEEGRAAITARAEAKQAAADQAAGIQRMDLSGPQVGAQGVAALGLVTPQQPGESDDQYQTRLRLSAGLMAVGFLKPGDSLVGEYGSGKPFYSQLARVVGSKIQKVGTVEQALAALRGNGVKAAELAWTGLDDFLKGMKPGTKVTRADLQDYLNTHQVDVHEVVRGDTLPQTWTAPDQAGDQVLFVGGQRVARVENLGNGRFGTYSLGSGLRGLYDTAAEARQAMEGANTATDPTRYGGYVLPGGQPGTYRELVLTTPRKLPEYQVLERQLFAKYGEDYSSKVTPAEADALRAAYSVPDPYHSSHWPEYTNPLGHVRFDERVDTSGRRVLHIDELQSDWSQAQRTQGVALPLEEQTRRYNEMSGEMARLTRHIGTLENDDAILNALIDRRGTWEDRWQEPGAQQEVAAIDTLIASRQNTLAGPERARWREIQQQQMALQEQGRNGVPPTPFAENFNDLAVKRMLYWAVDHGYDRISWDPGAVHAQRWGTERISWEKNPSGDGYRLLAEPQVGGNADGLDLQGEAEARGLIAKGSPVIVNSLDDLKNHLEQVGFAPSGARESAENRTIADKTWAKMQAADAGIFTPRKTGLETSYDTLLPQVFNKVGKVFGGKAGQTELGSWSPQKDAFHVIDTTNGQVVATGDTIHDVQRYADQANNLQTNTSRYIVKTPTGRVHSFDIPASMKDAVLGEGMPLYSGVHPTVMVQGVKQLTQGAGAVGKWALKNPGKATLASAAAFTAIGAYTRAQQQAKTGQQYGNFSDNPTINRIATFGGGAVQPRDFFEGSGIYGDQAILPAAEWAMETIDVVPWGIAKLLGSDPSKTKGGIFNTDHTLAWVGDAFGGPTQSNTSLYDGLRQRSQEYKIDQPLASFALSLPFDPLNWLGWGVGEKSAPKIAEAFAATSKEGIAARISRLEDTQFAMQEGQRSIWNWAGQLSRGARAGQLADEHARLTIMAAGAPNVRASAFLEDVAAKAIKGTASGDELKIANILAKRPTVTEDAVRKLAEDLGVRLEPNDAIEPDLITEISNRVESKHAWNPEDVNWLKDQFDSLRPLENAIQNNVVAWHQGLNGQAATMADFEKLRRLYHVAPNVTFSTGMGAGRPEALKSTLETINQFLNGRPLLRTDGSANLLRPSEVSFIGKMLGRKGWGLTQDTRINAWAAKYGLPDLEPVIKRVQGMSAGDLAGTVAGITRRDFPQGQSALRPWLEAHPFALSISNAWDKINEKVGLPLTLSYLGSVGWPVHMARTLVQRNPEITVTQVLPAIARAGAGLGTSAYHAARSLPQGPGFAAQELVRGVKSELGNLAFWHNTDLIDQAYWGIYPGSFLHGGHAMGQLRTDVNGMTPGVWPLGRWFFGLNAGDSLKQSVARGLIDIKAARSELVNGVAPTVEQAAQVPAHPLNLLQQAGASVLHNANIAKVYGVASNAVGVMDTSMRQAFVAWQHPIVYKQVLGWLGEKTQIAQQALDRVTARPAQLTDASWKRVRSLAELHGASGKMSQLVDTALNGTIDRNAFAQAAFQEPDLPEFMKSELWGALNRATPKDLTTIFTRGGYADQLLDKVLQQQYTGRVSEALNQVVADLRPRIAAINRASPEGKLLYQSTIRDGWQKMEAVLNDQMEMHHRLWQWAYAAKNYAPEGQKDQFFANIVQLRQKLIADGQDEAKGAMRLWRQQILRKGIPFPEDVLKAYDNIYDHILGSFQASDQATKEAWAFTRANSGPGSRQAVSDKWDQVWRQNAETWQNYRGWRDSQQEKIYARIEQYYSAKKGLSPADRASAAQELLPEPIKTVPDDVRLRAQAALERIRQVSDNFVNHPPVPEDQQQIIRAWATKVDQTAAQLPKDQLALIQQAHLATANMVMEQGNKRFINYLNRTNLDDAMTKTLFPFWIYDTRGANFYGWMMTHVPGAAESYAREIQDTSADPQGVGYFQGDYGAFGNEISPNRGLWDYRLVSIAKYILQNRPGTFGEEAARAFDHVVTEGLFGAHVSPLLGSAAQLATGSQLSDLSQPPLIQQAGDLATQATGQTYQTDSFSRRAIADAMVTNNVDPYHPTPGQQDTATKQAALQDLAQNAMPMFTRVLPERIAQRADFTNALVALGHSRAEQASVTAAGKSPWSLINKEQAAQLMVAHPGWKYLFEDSAMSLPPEEMKTRMELSDQIEQLHQITMARLTDQKKIDDQVLGSAGKPATISPQQWMDQRNNRMQQYLGAKDQFTSQPAWQAVQAVLDDPAKQKILQPEDQAVAEYYALQSDLIKKNTDTLGKINWEAVQQGTDAQIAQLTPFQQSYVRNELTKNETPVERTWHNALSQKQQYDAIPAWIGISPDMANRKQAAMTALNQLLNTRGADNAQRAAAFARQNNALIHAGRPNPARIRFMLQPENADLRFWFGRATTKNTIANATLDPAELAPWEYSPTVTGSLVAPDLNAAQDLVAAGG